MSKSVAVIGGGVIGLCSAYYLAKAGHKVTVLERGQEGYDCCSWGNAGMIVPSHFEPLAAPGMVGYGMRMMLKRGSPFGMRPTLNPEVLRWGWLFAKSCTPANVERGSRLLRDLNMASRSLYMEMSQASENAFGLGEGGLVMLCATQKALDAEAKLAEHARTLDLQVKILSSQEVEALEPTTRLTAKGAVHFMDDCHLDPPKLLQWLRKTLADMGVQFRYGSMVQGAVREGKRLKALKTISGDVEADEFVLAAGAWAGRLARELGFRMPLQGGKGYSVDLPVGVAPKHCFILVEGRVAVAPIGGKLRFGGTMEVVGDDLSVNPGKYQGILNAIPQYMPDFSSQHFAGLKVWAGLRPCSADGLPYLGRPASLDNLIVAGGHSMMGVSLAPITGKIVSQLASGEKTDHSLESIKPDRFN